MARILGIDPGSRVCGYGVVDLRADGSYGYVECGVLTAPEAHPMERRLGEIARGLGEILSEFTPEVVAIEDVFSHINVRSALALAQARGMALAVVGMRGLPVFSYPPAQVKKAVVGSGRADKGQVARMIAGLIGLQSAPPLDATDALGIALTHGFMMARSPARAQAAVIAPPGRMAP